MRPLYSSLPVTRGNLFKLNDNRRFVLFPPLPDLRMSDSKLSNGQTI